MSEVPIANSRLVAFEDFIENVLLSYLQPAMKYNSSGLFDQVYIQTNVYFSL